MYTVEQFLSFKLETGGLVIGWLTLISSILTAILSIIGLVIACIMDCEAIAKLVGKPVDTESCPTIRGVFVGLWIILLAIVIGCAVIGHFCIKGTKTRNHSKVKPMMILLAICTVVSILNIFGLTAQNIASGIIGAIIDAYCFIEFERGNANKEYEPPSSKVESQTFFTSEN